MYFVFKLLIFVIKIYSVSVKLKIKLALYGYTDFHNTLYIDGCAKTKFH
jgi:hypothetical protein